MAKLNIVPISLGFLLLHQLCAVWGRPADELHENFSGDSEGSSDVAEMKLLPDSDDAHLVDDVDSVSTVNSEAIPDEKKTEEKKPESDAPESNVETDKKESRDDLSDLYDDGMYHEEEASDAEPDAESVHVEIDEGKATKPEEKTTSS